MRGLLLLGLLLLPSAAQAQVGVELDDVTDNRVSAGQITGSLEIRVKLKGGAQLEKASAARIVVKEAKDDRGNALADSSSKSAPDFTPRDYNSGTLQFSLRTPARTASSVKLKGTVELFVPGRDPNAVVTVDKALGKLDAPLSAKALKAAKVNITPLSRTAYAAALKERKIDDKKIEEIRAAGKAHGASEKDIETAIALAKAFDAMDTEPAANAVILSGGKDDFDRVFRVEVLGADGKPIDTRGRSTSTRGESAIMVLEPSEAPPANASLQLMLLTDKARVSYPFELTVRLP
jgi:hypothetical protein